MNNKMILMSLALAVLSSAPVMADSDNLSGNGLKSVKEFRNALRLNERGMGSRSAWIMEELGQSVFGQDPVGYSVLNDVAMDVSGYMFRMDTYVEENPHSALIPYMKYLHALNLFDKEDYENCARVLDEVSAEDIDDKEFDTYIFKKAYCAFVERKLDKAAGLFGELDRRQVTDYTAPARYALGYIRYEKKDFEDAIKWFEAAAADRRFKEMADYYILECRFMLKDYEFVAENGDAMYASVPEERKSHLARIISESWLVLGDVQKAKEYYELGENKTSGSKTRSDLFYSGSLLYAIDDFEGAIADYSKMTDRTDSLGQIANYQLGYSYIQTKNKVAALDAFKDAASVDHDLKLKEDAFFNWAKLAFDLNDDTSVFNDYIKAYPAKEQEQRINSYIAVAALHDRDYEGAVNAYDKIDELDEGMVSNYMKANYLRANQLIKNGSYRLAIPCLKAAAYYSDRSSRFNQLSRYWLAESYYRNAQYREAIEVMSDLYNTSALYGMAESEMIPYNIAYCYFKNEEYGSALRWFDVYLQSPNASFRKEALVRSADCHFMAKDYKKACEAYDGVIAEYFDVNDIYPYYQAAVAYGLLKKPAKKIELLSNVMDASPSSEFYPEALYELGRAYVAKYEDEKALECFERLASDVKDSTFVARAYIEMGSLSRNQSQYSEALKHYKKVVEEMPLSGYAEDALAAIESIYQIRNKPEEYLEYIESIGKGGSKTDEEKEDMIFNSAEQIFLSENYQKALVALDAYLEQYPDGRNVYKADFYKAESYKMLGQNERACDSYRKVIEEGQGSFVELSMLSFSELSYKLEKWEDAFGGYSSLYDSAVLENNKLLAMTGMMRSAFKGHNWVEAIKGAGLVLSDSRFDAQTQAEAKYVKAKSYLATSRRTEAFEILSALAEDVSGQYGAEAAYMLIQDCYDRGDFEAVETKVYAFSEAGTSHMYWLAKSFIVLGDSFVEREELKQAKATFESIRDGYEPQNAQDDVQSNVEVRLKRLAEMMTE